MTRTMLLNEEYRRKYGPSSAVEHITIPKAQATTLRIVRADRGGR